MDPSAYLIDLNLWISRLMYTTPPIPPDLKGFFNDHATHARSISSLDAGTSSIFDNSAPRSLALADIDLSAFAHSNYTMGAATTPLTAVYLPLISYPYNYTSYLDKFWPADMASVLQHQPTSVHAILVPILSMLSVPVLIVPFIFHIRHSNTGAWGILLCLILANFFSGLNALLWPNANFAGWYNGVGLCDLQSRISWPLTCAVASCTLCIVRGLANVLDIDNCDVNPPSRNKRKQKLAVELMICWFVPLTVAALSYLVQDQRYWVMTVVGCIVPYDNSWPTIVLTHIWPMVFSLGAVYYTIIIIIRLRHHRASIHSLLISHKLTSTRFLRLFILSIGVLVVYLPVQTYFFAVNMHIAWIPYSWARVHSPQWNTVFYLNIVPVYLLGKYSTHFMAASTFAFLGMGDASIRAYKKALVKLGFGKLFPNLKGERRGESDRWIWKLSLIRLARKYFDRFIGAPEQDSRNWNSGHWSESGRGMMESSTGDILTSQTNTSFGSRKPSVAAIEHAISTHHMSSDPFSTRYSYDIELGVLPPPPQHYGGGRRPSEFSHSQTTTLDCQERSQGRGWWRTMFGYGGRPRAGEREGKGGKVVLGVDAQSQRQRRMEREVVATLTETRIWSSRRSTDENMGGRYGRLDSAVGVAPDAGERDSGGVRVKKSVGITREPAK